MTKQEAIKVAWNINQDFPGCHAFISLREKTATFQVAVFLHGKFDSVILTVEDYEQRHWTSWR